MALKRYNPITPSLRQLITVDYSELWKGKPEKSLTTRKKNSAGRNNAGRITSRRRSGRGRIQYREIDFKRRNFDQEATVERIEYDPNRTCFIALIRYENGDVSYILSPQKLSIGDKVVSSEAAEIHPGNSMKIKNIPVGTMVHNIELKPGAGGKLIRTAGGYAQIYGKELKSVLVRLRSGEVRYIHGECMATIGVLSNPDHQNISIGKAGRNRWLGRRPSVRGVVMNPVDHPHGGGEGKTSGGRHPVSPTGKPTKGKRTRSNKRTDKSILRRRYSK